MYIDTEDIQKRFPLGDNFYWCGDDRTFGVRERTASGGHYWWHIWVGVGNSEHYEKGRVYWHRFDEEREETLMKFDTAEEAIQYMYAQALFGGWMSAYTTEKYDGNDDDA